MKGNIMVRTNEKPWLLAAFFLFLLTFIIGCDDKGGYDTKGTGVLTKEQILKIANRAARGLHFPLTRKEVLYDVEEAEWQKNAKIIERLFPGWSKKLEILNGRDYVIVLYRPKEATEIGDVLWLFIDRKTGEVIMYEM